MRSRPRIGGANRSRPRPPGWARFLNEGRAAPLERMRADAAVAAALADRAAALGRLEVAEAGLARLVGTSPERTRGSALVAVRGK